MLADHQAACLYNYGGCVRVQKLSDIYRLGELSTNISFINVFSDTGGAIFSSKGLNKYSFSIG